MNTTESGKVEDDFFANPQIVENHNLLREIGVLEHIDSLNREIQDYRNLITGALDIFNRTTIDEITDAAVWQISGHFLPVFVAFLWKPLATREDIVIKSYKNYRLVDFNIDVESLAPFDSFFRSHGEPIAYDLLAGELEAARVFDSLEPELVIPILGPSGLYGLVLVGKKTLEEKYSAAELSYLKELMSFVSQSIQNHLHYERTLRDAKTGLYNNGFFMTRLNDEIARVHRNNFSTSIIIIDVDRFKNFNDRYGHMAGDRVLESLALVIKQGVRLEDIPSRFGGEEFTVLLPNTGRKAAWAMAERLRLAVADMKVPWEPLLPPVTISLGIYVFDQNTNVSAEEIIGRADEAMYLSKERGRNRTTVWNSGLLAKIELLGL